MIKKLLPLLSLCASFAFSPFELRGMDGKLLGQCAIVSPSALAENIQAHFAEPTKAYSILCGTQHLEEMKKTDFPDPDALVTLTLVRHSAQAVVSLDYVQNFGMKSHIKIIGTDVQIVVDETLKNGNYIFETLDNKTLLVAQIVIGSSKYTLADRTGPYGIFFNAGLREYLGGIDRNALSQLHLEYPYRPDVVCRAVKYLMYELLLKQTGFNNMPAELGESEGLADRIRPVLPAPTEVAEL